MIETETEIVIDMNILKRKPKPTKEKIKENIGSSIMNKIAQVKKDRERYSSMLNFIPLFFKSFLRSPNNFKCGSICLLNKR